jgi:hypothetical protein
MAIGKCEVQRRGEHCGCPAIAVWNWDGPKVAMCAKHDAEMRRHVANCKHCQNNLKREEL